MKTFDMQPADNIFCGNMDGWGGEIGGLFPVVVYWQFVHGTHHLMAYTEVICLHGCK